MIRAARSSAPARRDQLPGEGPQGGVRHGREAQHPQPSQVAQERGEQGVALGARQERAEVVVRAEGEAQVVDRRGLVGGLDPGHERAVGPLVDGRPAGAPAAAKRSRSTPWRNARVPQPWKRAERARSKGETGRSSTSTTVAATGAERSVRCCPADHTAAEPAPPVLDPGRRGVPERRLHGPAAAPGGGGRRGRPASQGAALAAVVRTTSSRAPSASASRRRGCCTATRRASRSCPRCRTARPWQRATCGCRRAGACSCWRTSSPPTCTPGDARRADRDGAAARRRRLDGCAPGAARRRRGPRGGAQRALDGRRAGRPRARRRGRPLGRRAAARRRHAVARRDAARRHRGCVPTWCSVRSTSGCSGLQRRVRLVRAAAPRGRGHRGLVAHARRGRGLHVAGAHGRPAARRPPATTSASARTSPCCRRARRPPTCSPGGARRPSAPRSRPSTRASRRASATSTSSCRRGPCAGRTCSASRLAGGAPRDLAARLAAAGVFVSVRGDAVRVSPHVYNVPADVDRLLAVLAEAVPSAG